MFQVFWSNIYEEQTEMTPFKVSKKIKNVQIKQSIKILDTVQMKIYYVMQYYI